jgi:transposase-like protein
MQQELIKSYFKELSEDDRTMLLKELEQIKGSQGSASPLCQEQRRNLLNNRQGCCAHCGHSKYVKFGIDKGAQRYKCKSCKRSFTEYSGTWMSGLQRKDKIDDYLRLMLEELSLDKIKSLLKINKKTAFDWRHKILASVQETDKGSFSGITESDETFFLDSKKGKELQTGKARKRGGKSNKRGVNDEHIAVIVTQDRKSQIDLTVVTTGRLKKVDIQKAIGDRVNDQTVLCSDSHVSYKGFAIDKKIEHHRLRTDLKQYVKDGHYHIQHVNSIHNRIKKWIDNKFWGVSTKYLQNYLNWFRMKEMLRNDLSFVKTFAQKSMEDINALKRYKHIDFENIQLISTQN